MKKLIALCVGIVTVFGISGISNAILIDRGGGLIYDNVLDITWLQDANYAETSGYDSDGRLSWYEAVDWADGLTFGGYDDWRLPSVDVNGDGSLADINNNPDETELRDDEFAYMHYFNLGSEYGEPVIGDQTVDGVTLYNIQYNYWYGTDIEPSPGFAAIFQFVNGFRNAEPRELIYAAWAVRDGDVSVVPEPLSSTLFIVGGATLGFRRFRKKFRK